MMMTASVTYFWLHRGHFDWGRLEFEQRQWVKWEYCVNLPETEWQQTTVQRITYTAHIQLDSLRWSSERRSPTPHFWGCATRGAITSKFKLGQDFCTMHLPKPHHPMFTHSEVIVLTNTYKQTNRCCWKHPTHFAMLRHRVISSTTIMNSNKNDNLLLFNPAQIYCLQLKRHVIKYSTCSIFKALDDHL